MPDKADPKITLILNFWTLMGHPSPEAEWSLDQKLDAVKAAGFDAYCCPIDFPDIKQKLADRGLLFGGAFDAAKPSDYEPKIKAILEIGDGPINCQLADHDTTPEEAIPLTVQLMEASEKLGAHVHLEAHRDTCTETPEKTAAIIEGYKKATGKIPLVNFDYSHPATIKHLNASNYIDRLFEDVETFQNSRLWHMRPFNGHHCQVPITDGQGNFSPEYKDLQPFIRQAFDHWLAGPRPGNTLWVMPELGPKHGYGLSSFPCIWDDAVVLAKDLQKIWSEAVAAL